MNCQRRAAELDAPLDETSIIAALSEAGENGTQLAPRHGVEDDISFRGELLQRCLEAPGGLFQFLRSRAHPSELPEHQGKLLDRRRPWKGRRGAVELLNR